MPMLPVNNYATKANKLTIALIHNDYDYIESLRFNALEHSPEDFEELIALLKSNLKDKKYSKQNINEAIKHLGIENSYRSNGAIPRTKFDGAFNVLHSRGNEQTSNKESQKDNIKKAIILGIGLGCLLTAITLTCFMSFGLVAAAIPLTVLTAFAFDSSIGFIGGLIVSSANDKITKPTNDFIDHSPNDLTLSNVKNKELASKHTNPIPIDELQHTNSQYPDTLFQSHPIVISGNKEKHQTSVLMVHA